jgi:hypothetical protein
MHRAAQHTRIDTLKQSIRRNLLKGLNAANVIFNHDPTVFADSDYSFAHIMIASLSSGNAKNPRCLQQRGFL